MKPNMNIHIDTIFHFEPSSPRGGGFRGIPQQDAIEVGGYRSRGLERAVLERAFEGAGCYRSRRI